MRFIILIKQDFNLLLNINTLPFLFYYRIPPNKPCNLTVFCFSFHIYIYIYTKLCTYMRKKIDYYNVNLGNTYRVYNELYFTRG